jgi:hypothetical protein
MNAVILTQDQFDSLVKRMDEIQSTLSNSKDSQAESFLDNQQFLQLMKVSKRTAQSWRDEGIITFSQVGSKIYYQMSDVQKLLEGHKRKAFKK